MTDEDFQSLTTLYLEGAISDEECQRMNRELASSHDRIREFNDMRLLIGMIHEHGLHIVKPSAREVENRVELSTRQTVSRNRRQWMSTAALVAAGAFIGCLATGTLWAFSTAHVVPMKSISVEVSDGGFESGSPDSEFGYPVSPGVWTGDRVEIVESGDQGISSYQGKHMLRFKHTWGDSPGPKHHRANRWQIVDLHDIDLKSRSAMATLRTRFNRIDGPDTDTHCRVEIHAFEGDPASAEVQSDAKQFLSGAILRGQIDSDTDTWETMEVSAKVPSTADYLLIGISVFEDKRNDPPHEVEFTGHYADGVELILGTTARPKKPNSKTE